MFNKIEKNYFRLPGSLRPNLLAFLYCQISYFGGAALILSLNPISMVLGTFAMAHGMTIAAYIIHDLGHNALFKSPRHNAMMGRALNWLTGSCYATYDNMRMTHMRHHVDNADVILLDYRGYLAHHQVLRRTVEVLEWLYVPVIEFLMHGMLILAPFIREDKKDQRARVIGIMVIRFSLLLMLFLHSPLAYACYLLAYAIFLTILRFMDALQHNYDLVPALGSDADLTKHRGDRGYEESHTFSNLISTRYPWLNLLTLNFGYHNAHHTRPTAPWHELPKLHGTLYGTDIRVVIPFGKQLSSFHKNRTGRVIGDDSETRGDQFAQRLREGTAVGAGGVSFLTPL